MNSATQDSNGLSWFAGCLIFALMSIMPFVADTTGFVLPRGCTAT